MATKTVTLKDSNGDTLYPVTDSNVVNINQQKTLAQALDGVVYAEDPTQEAEPTAWVKSSDVDWSTFFKTGTASVTYQADNSPGGFVQVTFDTPFQNTPVVFAQDNMSNGRVSSLTVSNITTTGFRLLARTSSSQNSGVANIVWVAISPNG